MAKINFFPAIFIFLSVVLAEFLFCMHPMLASTYFDAVPSGLTYFLASFWIPAVIYGAILWYMLRNQPEKSGMMLFLVLLTFLMQSATAVILPLYPYAAGRELSAAEEMSKIYFGHLVLFFISTIGALVLTLCERKILKRNNKVVFWLTLGMNVVISLVLLFGNDGYGTTTIRDIQVGLPLMAYMFMIVAYQYHSFWEKNPETEIRFQKHHSRYVVLHVLSLVILILGYLGCREFGIPSYFLVSVTAWVLFFLQKKPKYVIQLISAGIVLVLGLAIGYYFGYYKKINEEFRSQHDFMGLGDKLERMAVAGEQANTAKRMIATGGVFGTLTPQYMPEWKTDFSIVTAVHHIGLLWLGIVIVCLIFLTFYGVCCLKNEERDSTVKVLPALSFICIVCLCTYNIMGNTGAAGIIGVSCYAAGYGKTASILSGMLFGFLLYPENLISADGRIFSRKEH